MSDSTHWAFPATLQPTAGDVRFDLKSALDSVVIVHSEIPDDAFTASVLGTERIGNGVVIREDGLVLTIGYLITEAETIWLSNNTGAAVEATVMAFDFATGFGLVQPLRPLSAPPMPRGSTATAGIGDDVIVIGHGGRAHALKAAIVAKREFAGYWEYVLDEAIFTAPPHPQWGGAALVDDEGKLLGIGSLFIQEVIEGESSQGNMFVPIDLLEPILDDLVSTGRSRRAPRAWLGMYAADTEDRVVVNGLAPGAPAQVAGLELGDIVIDVGGERITGLADCFRKIWRAGPPGVEIPLTLLRKGVIVQIRVHSGKREDHLKKPRLQ